jgi:hypothetical protein
MQLIYLSSLPWRSFAQRPHKFVEWFHARSGGAVLWVDPYPTRFPCLGDLRRQPVQAGLAGKAQSPGWLTVLHPRALPIEPLPLSGWVNGIFWKDLLREMVFFAERTETIAVIGKPSALALNLLNRLTGIKSFYDAMDDFPAFYSGVSRVAMTSRERALVGQVTRVFASSTMLQKRWSLLRDDVRLIPNAFDEGVLPGPRLQVVPRSKKFFGYVGTVGRWFDWDWFIALAKARPMDAVRLIGPVFVEPPCRLPANVELLPAQEHKLAVQAMLDFDVGLIPFKRNDLTASVDPIKYYEYRALGLPVISTGFGEMILRSNEKGTFVGNDLQRIHGLVEQALTYRPNEEEIRQFRKNNSWGTRFAETGLLS